MSFLRRATALVLVVTILLTSQVSAHATMRWGLARQPTSEFITGACVMSAQLWLQELGASGITRLRAKFELRALYDPGLPATTYLSSGWGYSAAFPDDSRSLYVYFGHSFRYVGGGRYNIRAVLIGERPSFWSPDRKLIAAVGEVGCPFEFGT